MARAGETHVPPRYHLARADGPRVRGRRIVRRGGGR
jgi:hypothetical protein